MPSDALECSITSRFGLPNSAHLFFLDRYLGAHVGIEEGGFMSSKSAAGHIGTGIGNHSPAWVHYNAPTAGALDRAVFTTYSYADAHQKITAADPTSGSLTVNATVYDRVRRWYCGNGRCGGASPDATLPNRNGCRVARSGWHTWNARNTWVARAGVTTATLYYDKSGARTLVSYHAM